MDLGRALEQNVPRLGGAQMQVDYGEALRMRFLTAGTSTLTRG